MILIGSAESFTHSRVSDDISSIEVKKGSSLNSILNNFSLNLYEIFLLKIFLKFNDIEMIQAGFYDLNNLSWRDFLKSLSEGKVKIFKLEIPEGKNLYEIDDILARSSLTNDCFNFDCLKNSLPFIEGTLRPDTYFYQHAESSSIILQKSQSEFLALSNDLWQKRSNDLPLTELREALILASIVEKEAGNEDEKSIIAGVFLHRLHIGMRLQADPTIIYGLLPNFNGNITKANLMDKNNIFNTYQINGLPPTPISTISKTSLEAVILGERNDYLYFVAKGDGTHKFSRTYKEHLQAVKKYQLN